MKITSHLLSMDFNSAAFLLDIDGVMLLFWTLEYRCWFEDSEVWKEFWLRVSICFMDRRKVYSSLGFQERCEENNFHLQWSHQKLNLTCTLEYVCWLEDSELRVPSSEELLALVSEFRRSEF